jgi:TetR/AcrR family transcriptional regulator, cholesterol catabolism regulator
LNHILFPAFFDVTFAPRKKEMSQLENIITKSGELFLRYGVKNLTMDEIAKQLGMSKKTIYQYVTNKSDLVQKVMQAHLDKEDSFIKEVQRTSQNALEENLRMITFMSEELQGFNAVIFFDLQKYYPESYALFNEHREKVALRNILNNLKSGIKEGLYRKDINTEIVSRIFVSALDILIDQQRFPSKKYHFYNLYKEFINYHLGGILTPKGVTFLEQSKLLKSLMP